MAIWKSLPQAPEISVSDEGEVYSFEYGHLLHQYTNPLGYRSVSIRRKVRKVHQLVLEAFVGVREPDQVTRHLNGNPSDNRLSNLKYGTPSENMFDRVLHGTHMQAAKTTCIRGHHLSGDNVYDCPSRPGVRYCVACRALHQARRLANRKAQRQTATA